jgi:hypothetical protein
MQGHHRTRKGLRQRDKSAAAAHAGDDCHDQTDGTPARLFLCQGCRVQVLICSHCDRGHRYCADGCALKARKNSQRDAGRRYQMSRRGRVNHAARSRRHRARKNNVTHQGSPQDQSDGLLAKDPAGAMMAQSSTDRACLPRWHCHRCGRRCLSLVRRGFLRRCRGSVEQSTRTLA